MNKLYCLMKLYSQKMLEYRGDVFVWTLSNFIEPLLALLIWLSVLAAGASLVFSKSEITLYFLAVMFMNSMTSAWSAWFIAEDIKSGEASKYLLKPLPMIYDHLAWNLSEKIYKIIITLVVVLVIGLFNYPSLASGGFNITFFSVFLSIISLFMAMVIYFYLDQIIGIITFWTHDNDFFRNYREIFEQLFSGVVIPFVFLPGLLKSVALILPFRYAGGFPAEVLLNGLEFDSLLLGFSVQAIWVVITVAGYNFLYKKGTKIYQGFGS